MEYTDTVVQNEALARAEQAFADAAAAYEGIQDDQVEFDSLCQEADAQIAEAKKASEDATTADEEADQFVEDIQTLVDEFDDGDGDSDAEPTDPQEICEKRVGEKKQDMLDDCAAEFGDDAAGKAACEEDVKEWYDEAIEDCPTC